MADLPDGVAEAIAEVWYEVREHGKATSPLTQAHHLLKLDDAVGDLASWHPRYNSRTGMIDGVYEEGDG